MNFVISRRYSECSFFVAVSNHFVSITVTMSRRMKKIFESDLHENSVETAKNLNFVAISHRNVHWFDEIWMEGAEGMFVNSLCDTLNIWNSPSSTSNQSNELYPEYEISSSRTFWYVRIVFNTVTVSHPPIFSRFTSLDSWKLKGFCVCVVNCIRGTLCWAIFRFFTNQISTVIFNGTGILVGK